MYPKCTIAKQSYKVTLYIVAKQLCRMYSCEQVYIIYENLIEINVSSRRETLKVTNMPRKGRGQGPLLTRDP